MNSADCTLLLWLEGPLQAWGHDSKFGVRDTLKFPTRSGVMGLLCCARGAGGPETAWLAMMQQSALTVAAYLPSNSEGMASLPELTLCDFQMVGSGYAESDPWQSLLSPKKSDGKKPVGGGSKLTYRYYLQNTAFGVLLRLPAAQAAELKQALQNPVWDLYLGRKNCPPTEFIFQGCFATDDAAWQQAEQLAASKQRRCAYRVIEGEHEGDSYTLNDVPICFGEQKRYRDRRVTLMMMP